MAVLSDSDLGSYKASEQGSFFDIYQSSLYLGATLDLPQVATLF